MKEFSNRRWMWVWIGFFLIGGMFTFRTPGLWAVRTDQIDKDITQKKKDIKDIKKEISITKGKEKEIRGKESSILGTLHLLGVALYQKEKEIKQMEGQRSRPRTGRTKQQVVMLSKRMERTKEEFFSRLIALYKMENSTEWSLSPHNLSWIY
jgi:septal ring factor EnvC (AmiA/AmiB activator)